MTERMISEIDRELELSLSVASRNLLVVDHLKLLEQAQLSLVSKLESRTATSEDIKADKVRIEGLKKEVKRLENEAEEAEKSLREFREK